MKLAKFQDIQSSDRQLAFRAVFHRHANDTVDDALLYGVLAGSHHRLELTTRTLAASDDLHEEESERHHLQDCQRNRVHVAHLNDQ